MVFPLTYLNAGTSLVLVFGIAWHMGPEAFSAIALGLTAGGFAAVLVNLGSDQVQIAKLLCLNTSSERKKLSIGHLSLRVSLLFGFAAALGVYLAFSDKSLIDGSCALLFAVWAGSIGLQPNAYVDYLEDQKRQQVVVFLERGTALALVGAILWMRPTEVGATAVLMAAGLLVSRLISTSAQWIIVIRSDSREEHHLSTSLHPSQTTRSSLEHKNITPSHFYTADANATVAAVVNSFRTYVPVLLLDYQGLRADLSLYSLCLQAVNFVLIFQGMAIRLVSAKISTVGNDQASLIKSQNNTLKEGRKILRSSLYLGIFGSICTITYLGATPTFSVNHESISLVIVMFLWGSWMGIGQPITRNLLATGNGGLYLRAAIVTTLCSLTIAYFAVPPLGAIGSALATTVPHSIMIAHFFHIYRKSNRYRM